MSQHAAKSRHHIEIQALVRVYQALEGTAIGLASVSMDGLDQSWRDRVQRIRALPREAPRRKNMIDELGRLIEQTLWQRQPNIEELKATHSALAAQAAAIAARGGPAEEPSASSHPTES